MTNISELATNIHRLSTVLGRVADRTLQECCGFGISQFKILWILREHHAGMQQASIAGCLNQTEAAVSRQISLLEQDGMITNEVDPINRRNHIIKLSKAGKTLSDKAMDNLTEQYKPYFADLNEMECRDLNLMLDKVFRSVVKDEYKEGK